MDRYLITSARFLLAGTICGIVAHVNAEAAWSHPERQIGAIVWAIFAGAFILGSAILAIRRTAPAHDRPVQPPP